MIRVVLKDIVEKPITGEWGDEGTSVNVLRTTNFTNEGFIDYTKVVKRDIEQKKIDTKRLHRGDIIIEKSGGSPTQPVGRVVYFDSEEIYLCNNFTAILRPKKEQVFPKYLQYILFVGHQFGLTSAFQNKTTGIINLQLPKYLEGVQVPLPPLPQQQKIANILDAADALRQNDKALISKYDELNQALFLDMFGDPVSNPKGWEKIDLGKLTKRIVVGHVGPTSDGYSKEGVPFLRTQNVRPNFINYKDIMYVKKEFHNKLQKSKIYSEDILISRVGVNRGMAAIVPKDLNEANCANVVIVGSSSYFNSLYISFFLNKSFGTKPEYGYSVGSAQGVVNTSIVKKWPVFKIPIDLQNQFAVRVAVIEEQKAIAQKSLEKSEELFNSLLQRAFKGELV